MPKQKENEIKVVNIRMVDHIVVAGESGQMMSFKAEGLLDDHTSSKMSKAMER